MSDDEIEFLCLNLKLDRPAVDIVNKIRNSPPVRSVRGGRNNVRGRYPSELMGVTIQFESHTCELPVIYLFEHVEKDVREYYDQPYTFTVEYKTRNGRKITPTYTPDFFVVRNTFVEFIECKTEDELRKMAEDRPGYFVLGKDGVWHCPPAEEALGRYGFRHRVISSAAIDLTLYNNLLFFEDYLRVSTPQVSPQIFSTVLQAVKIAGRVTLEDLLNLVFTTGGTADDIYTLIAKGDLYVDLSAELIEERKYVWVYPDVETAEFHRPPDINFEYAKAKYATIREGARFAFNDGSSKIFRIVLIGDNKIFMESEDGSAPCLSLTHFERLVKEGELRCLDFESDSNEETEALRIINSATKKAIVKADFIKRIIERHNAGFPLPEGVPQRTFEYWKSRWITGQKLYESGYAGVVFDYRARGDRKTVKIDPPARAQMDWLIENDYENDVAQGIFAVWSKLVLWCEEQNPKIKEPCYQTFIRYVQKRPQHLQALKRLGHRAAYDLQPYYPRLEKDTPPHGTRPFQIVHIDHTLLDIELVDPTTGKNMGKPWLTLMMDAFSRRILALYLTFDPPSYRSDMMVFRECVRKWGYLPQTIVTDGGSDFHGGYYQMLTAAFDITVKTRPAHEPRFGAVIERLFGITNTEFIHLLRGNTKLRRKIRQVSGTHDPSRLAAWTLEALDESLCDWAYNRYDTESHGTLKRSPRDVFESTIRLTGERRHRLLPFDREFLILTMPPTKKGTAKVQPGGRVKIDYDYYACDDLESLVGSSVEVRFDPLNIMYAYVRIKEKWVQCVCNNYLSLARMTERQRKLYSDTERQDKRLFARGLRDRALERALKSGGDKVKEQKLIEVRRLALSKEQQNDAPMRRVMGDFFEDFNPTSPPSADRHTTAPSVPQAQKQPLFAGIDTNSLPKLSEYKG
ncbi:MAG TPA: TnsA endonuclease N-terminal domain-containing protein [Pyrinomonadaceae bacterium]|jgi:transposase InsO family protein|nr:TnsA endonuclease N-terminal domain-containing protein [Pyrinomonadaceae bacterium]